MTRMKTNPNMVGLIRMLKKKSRENDTGIWKCAAIVLEKPSRRAIALNLSSISRNTDDGDVVLVLGKVLASGDLDHKLKIAAVSFSDKAKSKVSTSGSSLVSIEELVNSNPKGTGVKLLG